MVTCSRGDFVYGVGEIMGARGSNNLRRSIAVNGLGVVSKGTCYAITARYDGLEGVCIEAYFGQCQFGSGGENRDILSFDRIGRKTEISTSEYNMLLKYARITEYAVPEK